MFDKKIYSRRLPSFNNNKFYLNNEKNIAKNNLLEFRNEKSESAIITHNIKNSLFDRFNLNNNRSHENLGNNLQLIPNYQIINKFAKYYSFISKNDNTHIKKKILLEKIYNLDLNNNVVLKDNYAGAGILLFTNKYNQSNIKELFDNRSLITDTSIKNDTKHINNVHACIDGINIETLNNNEYELILYRGKDCDVYNFLGGKIEKDEDCFDNAIREAREESMNTVIINKNYIKRCNGTDIKYKRGGIIRIFIAFTYNYDEKEYYKNIKNMQDKDDSWKETDGVTRFNLESFKDYKYDNFHKIVKDINGNDCQIAMRVFTALKKHKLIN